MSFLAQRFPRRGFTTRPSSNLQDPGPAPLPRVPNVQFRVLVIGRANAGKTSILQRVCYTTESPVIYRSGPSGTRKRVELDPTTERGLHHIEDELIFTNYSGYVFHDSRGFESGGDDELRIVQEFVTRKSREKRLRDRLHAIWYCIPMENDRPSLDTKYFEDICPDKNVPVVAVFTKYDQFKRNIRMKLEDEGRDPETHFDTEVESVFDQYYFGGLSGPPPFVRLERMHRPDQRCTDLIEVTANALSGGVVILMLLAVQRDNLEFSVAKAVEWTHDILRRRRASTESVIRACVMSFPSIWHYGPQREDEDGDEHESSLDYFLEASRRFLKEEDFNLIFNKLTSLYSNPRLCISAVHDANHVMIATVLILEYTAILYASPARPSREEALNTACSRFIRSGTHNVINRLFLLSHQPYSTQQFTQFLLTHRLR